MSPQPPTRDPWPKLRCGRTFRSASQPADRRHPCPDEITEAFWQACHGGQRRMAEYLLACGADVNGVPGYSEQTPLDIAGSIDTRREALVTWLREHGATSADH